MSSRRVVIWSFVCVSVIALSISVLLPSLTSPRLEPSVMRCSSNLKQIYTAMFLYADENHNAAAPDFATLLETEDLVPEVFVCWVTNDTRTTATRPALLRVDLTPGSGHCSYVYVAPPGRFDLLPPDVVLAYEPPATQPGL